MIYSIKAYSFFMMLAEVSFVPGEVDHLGYKTRKKNKTLIHTKWQIIQNKKKHFEAVKVLFSLK